MFKKWFADDMQVDNTLIVKSTYKDNTFLPTSYTKTLEDMQQNNPTYYRIYALGDFCSLDKLIYNNWTTQDLDVVKLKQDSKLKLLVGLDFGFTNDVTALVTALIDEDNKIIYVIDEFTNTGLTNDKIADIIKTKGLSKSTIIADSAEAKSIEEIRRLDVPRIRDSAKGQGSVNNGIQRLQQYTIVVNSWCERTILELQNYSYIKDKKTGEYTNEPNKQQHFDHCLDALRYSLQCLDKKPMQVLSKSILGL